MYWLFIFVGFFILLGISQFLLAKLKVRGIHINRWLWAVASFLILIVPNVIAPGLPDQVNIGLYILCGVFALNFMIEQRAYVEKTAKRYPTTTKK